jgi:hypothetical protein
MPVYATLCKHRQQRCVIHATYDGGSPVTIKDWIQGRRNTTGGDVFHASILPAQNAKSYRRMLCLTTRWSTVNTIATIADILRVRRRSWTASAAIADRSGAATIGSTLTLVLSAQSARSRQRMSEKKWPLQAQRCRKHLRQRRQADTRRQPPKVRQTWCLLKEPAEIHEWRRLHKPKMLSDDVAQSRNATQTAVKMNGAARSTSQPILATAKSARWYVAPANHQP